MTIIGFMLNLLCQGGMSVVSWIIVFVPFMLMTVIVFTILYTLGLKSTIGSVHPKVVNKNIRKEHIEHHNGVILENRISPTYNEQDEYCYFNDYDYHHGIAQMNCFKSFF
jgi:hypothetical protein